MPRTAAQMQPQPSDLDWIEIKKDEWRAVGPGGVEVRYKRSGNVRTGEAFYYTYHGHRYCGVEHSEECARARAVCGVVRCAGHELEEFLATSGRTLPPLLRASEQARLERWRKTAKQLESMPPEPSPADHKTRTWGGGQRQGRVSKAGRIAPGDVFRFVEAENPYKEGTDRAKVAAIALEKNGQRVADALAAGAPAWIFRIMLEKGFITLEKKEEE